MIARSKLVILAFFSLIVMHLDVSGQSGNNIIDSTWFLLKEQLLRRSNLALQFSGLKGEKNPDTILFDELKDAASNLTLLLNSPCKLDSNQIVGIEAANYILVGLIQKSVMFSEDKNNFIPNE